MKITYKMNSCMRSLANSTGHSMSVTIFETASSKNKTYTQKELEIIMTTIQFSALMTQELILLSKDLVSTSLRSTQHWLRYVLDFASQHRSSTSSMNLSRTLLKLIQLRLAPLPSTDLEYILVFQGITSAWRCAMCGSSRMLKESITSESRWMLFSLRLTAHSFCIFDLCCCLII